MAAEARAQLEPDVLEAVEGGRDQPIALQVPVVLPLEFGKLPHLQIDAAARRQGGGFGLDAEPEPRLVHVDLPVGGGGIAVIEVDEIHLAVGHEPVSPDRVQEQGHGRDFKMRPLVHRLFEAPGLTGRELRRLEGKGDGEAVELAVAEIRLHLEAEAQPGPQGRGFFLGRLLRLLRFLSSSEPGRSQSQSQQPNGTPLARPALSGHAVDLPRSPPKTGSSLDGERPAVKPGRHLRRP